MNEKQDDFSFIKLIDQIKIKSQTQPSNLQDNSKKLKFEPNTNILRQHIGSIEPNDGKKQIEPEKIINIEDISSRFTNKDSINSKKQNIKKDKKTVLIPLQSLLEKKTEVKEKKHRESSDLKEALNLIKSSDSSSYLPIVLPFKNYEDSDNLNIIHDILNDQGVLNEEDFFLFQFPRILPINSDKQLQNELEDTDEPIYDNNGYLVTKEYENVFKSIPGNNKLGKLKFYKSGKIKLQMGDNYFDINSGITSRFAQELSVLSKDKNELIFLGNIKDKKIVVTPNMNI